MSLRAWKVVAVLMVVAFSFAPFAPSNALSNIGMNPSSALTGGTVTITITQTVGPGPDVFASLKVTDPIGNVFVYSGTPFSVSSGSPKIITFPNPGAWTPTSGPGGNAGGTDVSGMYTVQGTYLDTGLSALLGHFIVLSTHGNFGVPEFGQSLLLLAGVMLPMLLLLRLRMSSKQPI